MMMDQLEHHVYRVENANELCRVDRPVVHQAHLHLVRYHHLFIAVESNNSRA